MEAPLQKAKAFKRQQAGGNQAQTEALPQGPRHLFLCHFAALWSMYRWISAAPSMGLARVAPGDSRAWLQLIPIAGRGRALPGSSGGWESIPSASPQPFQGLE